MQVSKKQGHPYLTHQNSVLISRTASNLDNIGNHPKSALLKSVLVARVVHTPLRVEIHRLRATAAEARVTALYQDT